MLAIRIHETGGVEKLRAEEIPVPEPGPGEIRFRVEAAGVNFIDTYRRSGLYPVELPHTLGQEAAGVVTSVGKGVAEFGIGDRVAVADGRGGYAQEMLARAARVVPVAGDVSSAVAAALMVQGMTAHYLAGSTFPLQPGHAVLLHAAAGGTGLLLLQIAKQRGARVLATVGSEEKADLVRAAGADAVCIYTREDFTEAARTFTRGVGVDVVYDGVGRATFEGSLKSLRPRGTFVTFGNASGAVPEFKPLRLTEHGSLFLTRPKLADYTATTDELRGRAEDLFRWVAARDLNVRIGATFPLAQAADAHRALESRATTGKVVLIP